MSAVWTIDPPSLFAPLDEWLAYRASLNDLPSDDEIVRIAVQQADARVQDLQSAASSGNNDEEKGEGAEDHDALD